MSNLAIIPARGGSKGLPRKNVLPLGGMPLIAWTIRAAQAAARVDRVVVSTDDAEIAQVARRYGAEVITRPDDISGDAASSESALLHALEHYETTEGYRPELTVFLQCTSPLTAPEDIDGTVDALRRDRADCALAATDFHYFLWRRDETADALGINHDRRVRLLRQDREPQYLETGAVYVMRTEGFRRARHRFFGRTAVYEMPAERCLEIDEPVDFEVAEVLQRHRQRAARLAALPSRIAAVVLDFDGVMTDNRVVVSEDGRESVRCHRGDGWGIGQLRRHGIPLLVLSSEVNPVVAARCRKLDIPCIHGSLQKGPRLREWALRQAIDLNDVVYLGNDVNDLDCFQMVGCPVAVADAEPEVRPYARLLLERPGGAGAVRELCQLILEKESKSCQPPLVPRAA